METWSILFAGVGFWIYGLFFSTRFCHRPILIITAGSCGLDQDWWHFDSHCYYISQTTGVETQMDWFKAREYCMLRGGELVSMHNEAEWNAVLGLVIIIIRFLVSLVS